MKIIELNRDGRERAHDQALDVLQTLATAAVFETVLTENQECERRYRSGNQAPPDHINHRDLCGPDL